MTSRPAVWTPKKLRLTGTSTNKWVLGGRFQQHNTKWDHGNESFEMLTYDPRKTTYRTWYFDAGGNINEMTGDWDTYRIAPQRFRSIIAGSPRNSEQDRQRQIEVALQREGMRRTDARVRNSSAFPEPSEPLHLPSPMTVE